MRYYKLGFSLIEALVVIGIMAGLASILAVENISSFRLAAGKLAFEGKLLLQEARAGKALRHITDGFQDD